MICDSSDDKTNVMESDITSKTESIMCRSGYVLDSGDTSPLFRTIKFLISID